MHAVIVRRKSRDLTRRATCSAVESNCQKQSSKYMDNNSVGHNTRTMTHTKLGKHHTDFMRWAKSQGVKINGVTPAHIPGRGSGMIATRNIEVRRDAALNL